MEWDKGFSARYYCTVVDPDSWRDLNRIELTDGTVMKTTSNLMESADISLTELPEGIETWIRVWLDARQDDTGAHEAVFTGLMSAPGVSWDGLRKSYSAECYSVLKPAADVLLPLGWYAGSGMDGARTAADLLSVGAAPVVYANNAPALKDPIIAENNETNLSMAWKILEAIGWHIRLQGDGTICIQPYNTDPVTTLDALENDCVEMEITDTRDFFDCPNVFRATANGSTAIARDDARSSPLSTISRGREVWKAETNCKLNTGESLAEYAQRRLAEEQSSARTISYTRRYIPDVLPGDIIQITHPAQGIDGIFRVTSQKIELGYGARTSEEAERT